jgi:hypothetical protein
VKINCILKQYKFVTEKLNFIFGLITYMNKPETNVRLSSVNEVPHPCKKREGKS